jgi:hypothetical protein
MLSNLPTGYTPDSLALCLYEENCDMFETDGTQTLESEETSGFYNVVELSGADCINLTCQSRVKYFYKGQYYYSDWVDYTNNSKQTLNAPSLFMQIEFKLNGTNSTPILDYNKGILINYYLEYDENHPVLSGANGVLNSNIINFILVMLALSIIMAIYFYIDLNGGFSVKTLIGLIVFTVFMIIVLIIIGSII